MSLWSRLSSRPDPDVVADHRAATGGRGRVLAHATGPRVDVLALPDRFAVRVADEPWREVGWHQVRSGGWRADRDELHWRVEGGRREALTLTEPGGLPQVFRERVQASIAVEDQFEVPQGGAVVIAARRDLGQDHPELHWQMDAVRGASLEDPETRALADQALTRLRADYDF